MDQAGAELPDKRSAIAMAEASLGEMLADDLRAQRELANRCIVVTDEDGTTIAQVTMEDALQPLQSAPPACPA